MRLHRRLIPSALLWSLVGVAPASAQVPTIDAPTGQALPAAGGVLVDIRSPRELAGTGRPAGAVLVPLQDDDHPRSEAASSPKSPRRWSRTAGGRWR